MTDEAPSVEVPRDTRLAVWMRRAAVAPWELVVSGSALVMAGIAVWVTAHADFLTYPGWLALQKADFILGPVAVGLYWQRRRPDSRLGLLLIGYGFVAALYILQSSSDSLLFTIGVWVELLIFVWTEVLILTFPTGRLEWHWPECLIVAAMTVAMLLDAALLLVAPAISGDGSISGCKTACPANAFFVSSRPGWITPLSHAVPAMVVGIALATAALLIWRFVTGSTPRRRAFAVGAPVALLFLLSQATYQATKLFSVHAMPFDTFIRWTLVGTRAAIWYGFWLALIAAEVFAGRVLQRLVRQSLRRPSLRQLEELLRGPLGDPALRLGFWRSATSSWVDAQGRELEEPGASSSQVLTVVQQSGGPAAAIVHDSQLSEDPELLHAAGATMLLAYENGALESAWNESISALQDSRARIAAAGDLERRKIERDLHDGVQQGLIAVSMRIAHARDPRLENGELREELEAIARGMDGAIDELREISHGIYPAVLAALGLVAALEAIQRTASGAITLRANRVGRYATETEAALYYCCREAIQNASKHGGDAVRTSIHVEDTGTEVRVEIRDDGPGFDPNARSGGVGLRNMDDRLSALGGRLEIASAPGHGTVVSGSIPTRRPHAAE